jgi:hypothetical protein
MTLHSADWLGRTCQGSVAACERRVVTCVRVTVTCESDRVWSDASPPERGPGRRHARGRARVSGSASRGARPPALPYSTTPCTYIKIWLSLICHMVRFFATVPYKNTLLEASPWLPAIPGTCACACVEPSFWLHSLFGARLSVSWRQHENTTLERSAGQPLSYPSRSARE